MNVNLLNSETNSIVGGRLGKSDIIPHFANNGVVLTQRRREDIAKLKGVCVQCGVKFFFQKKKELTNEHVHDGTCIKCNPMLVPSKALQEWESRNPRHFAPAVSTSAALYLRPLSSKERQEWKSLGLAKAQQEWEMNYCTRKNIEFRNRLTKKHPRYGPETTRDNKKVEKYLSAVVRGTTKVPSSVRRNAISAYSKFNQTRTLEPIDERKPDATQLESREHFRCPAGAPKLQLVASEEEEAEKNQFRGRDDDSWTCATQAEALVDNKSLLTFENVSYPDTSSCDIASWSVGTDICDQKSTSTATVGQMSAANTIGSVWEDCCMAKIDPRLWSISYDQLIDLCDQAKLEFGEKFSLATLRDVNERLIEPICRREAKSYALYLNPTGLLVDAFVSHSWDEPFEEFVISIRKAFQCCARPPNLWICCFALKQGDTQGIQEQIGNDDCSLEESAFVVALKAATHFVVVRNRVTDLYSRIWCVCELVYASNLGFVPESTYVTGPDCFSHLCTSCLDAQATNIADKAKILRHLLDENDYQEIDEFVNQFRSQGTPA